MYVSWRGIVQVPHPHDEAESHKIPDSKDPPESVPGDEQEIEKEKNHASEPKHRPDDERGDMHGKVA